MTDLPKAISDAANIEASTQDSHAAWGGFLNGARWLYSHLTTAASDFDERAARARIDEFEDEHFGIPTEVREMLFTMARYQHSADSARIALAEEHRERAESDCDAAESRVVNLEAHITSLEREVQALRSAAPTSESDWRYDLAAHAEADRIRDSRNPKQVMVVEMWDRVRGTHEIVSITPVLTCTCGSARPTCEKHGIPYPSKEEAQS